MRFRSLLASVLALGLVPALLSPAFPQAKSVVHSVAPGATSTLEQFQVDDGAGHKVPWLQINPTSGAGTIVSGVIPSGTSVADPGTGKLEALLPVQTVTGTSKTFVAADLYQETRRSNSGTAMTDTFPASTLTGLTNGTTIQLNNVDATATLTLTAGSGTTVNGGSTATVSPGRSTKWVYDATATNWRPTMNSLTALLSSQIGTTAGTVAAGSDGRFANLTDLGGVPDLAFGLGASISSGSNVLGGGSTSCGTPDIGKTMLVPGAGTGGIRLSATISGCSGTNYLLSSNATFGISAATYQLSSSAAIVQSDGTGCVPGDTIPIAGGTYVAQGVYTILTCQVHSVGIAAAGSGGTSTTTAPCFLTGTTGTGEPFRVYATVAGGALTAVGKFIHQGDYTVNPSSLSAEPVTGCGLTGATLSLNMGVSQQVTPGSGITPSTLGNYTALPAEPVAQGTASGSESGVAFLIYFPSLGNYNYGTNNYTRLNTLLTALDAAGGGELRLGCGGRYLVSGGSLSLGDQGNLPGVTLRGCANLTGGGAFGNMTLPSAGGLYFDPTGGARINVFGSSAIRSTAILNALVPWNSGSDSFRQNANRSAAYGGVAVHFGNPNGGRGGSVLLEDDFIAGFSSAIETKNNGNWSVNRVKVDALNGVNITSIPDFSWLKTFYCNSFGYNASTDPTKNTIIALANNSGAIQVTTQSAHTFAQGDRIAIQFAGSYPNQPVIGYPDANGAWTVGAVIDANNFTLAGSVYNSAQTYTSGATVSPINLERQGECVYYNGVAAGNDGLYASDIQSNNWLHGIHVFGGQGQHWTNVGGQSNALDRNSFNYWIDGPVGNSEIIGGEIQTAATPFLDTTYGTNLPVNRIIGGQFQPSGYGFIFDHKGSAPFSVVGLAFSHAVSGYQSENINLVNIGDGAGQITFGGGSDLSSLGFFAQSYADWAKLTVSADTQIGGAVSAVGAVLPPAPINIANGASGTSGLKNPLGACDVAGSSVLCFGVRRELSTYTGPLVNVRRSGDNATMDLTQDQFGNLDQGKCAAFAGASTLYVTKWYEQRASVNNAFQTVAANQPALVCSVSQIAGKPGIFYGNGNTAYLLLNSASAWQGAIGNAIPGSIFTTVVPTSNGINTDRIFQINSGGGQNSAALNLQNGGYFVQFSAGYSTTSGAFPTSTALLPNVPSVVDITYSWTSTANVPTINFNGALASLGTGTTPVGTAGTDAGQPMSIGGIGSSLTTFPGYIETMMLTNAGPGAALLEQARQAQGAYYGMTVQ